MTRVPGGAGIQWGKDFFDVTQFCIVFFGSLSLIHPAFFRLFSAPLSQPSTILSHLFHARSACLSRSPSLPSALPNLSPPSSLLTSPDIALLLSLSPPPPPPLSQPRSYSTTSWGPRSGCSHVGALPYGNCGSCRSSLSRPAGAFVLPRSAPRTARQTGLRQFRRTPYHSPL